MAGTLSSFIFKDFQSTFEKRCMFLLKESYNQSIREKSISVEFEENDITAILHSYIDINLKRQKWGIVTNIENHLFNKTVKKTKGFTAKFSRIDMRFASITWLKNEYIYYVEAKILKAKNSRLKRRYIDTGIDNFLIGGKYYQCDGLLVGYILEGKTSECVDDGINKLLEKDKREKEILFKIKNNIYKSNHAKRELNHLFFSF